MKYIVLRLTRKKALKQLGKLGDHIDECKYVTSSAG